MEKIMNEKTIKFLEYIDKLGFLNAKEKFLEENPEFKTEFENIHFNQTIDSIFHCFTKNNNRCLQLSSGFGGGTEVLSNIFNEVYCHEENSDTRKILKNRLEFSKEKNIILCENLLNEINDKKDFFDLIICQNFAKSIKSIGLKNHEINSFLKQIFKAINNGGSFCFGLCLHDLLKFQIDSDHMTEKLTQFEKLKKILKLNGFKIDVFWVLPSLERPYYSSEISKETPLIWYAKNLRKFVKEENLSMKQKAISLFRGKIGEKIIKLKVKSQLDNFIFCCSKNESTQSLEDLIKKETGCKDILMISRPKKIIFISFNDNKPTKIVNFNRYGKIFPEKITDFVRTTQNLKNPSDRLWMENWIEGTKLNLKSEKEISLAIEWLINFQKNTRGEILSKLDIEKEINEIRNKLHRISFGNEKITEEWLNDYNRFFTKNKINKTSVHNDFWTDNIIIGTNNELHVIDWEKYLENSNPLIDFMNFFMRWMMSSEKKNIDAEVFEKNLSNSQEFVKIYLRIKSEINSHFGFELDIIIVLRYFILRRLTNSVITNSKLKEYTKIVNILSTRNIFL